MEPNNLVIGRAHLAHVDAVAPLFDAYRQFYKQRSDLQGAKAFLTERLANEQSVIFYAEFANSMIGFTQLYPIFSSSRMQKKYLLNDLYVSVSARKTGAGAALLDAAKSFAHDEGASALTLSTANDNFAAQSLYEANGWMLDNEFRVYNFSLRVE